LGAENARRVASIELVKGWIGYEAPIPTWLREIAGRRWGDPGILRFA
jgi:hypothetical protein